jgi:hypothetical protein
MTDRLNPPVPVPVDRVVACLRRLVHTFDDPADDADAFLAAMREARYVLEMLDAPEGTGRL